MSTTAPKPRAAVLATPALRASALLHAAVLGGVALQPAAWPLAVGAVVANHLLLTAAGLWPRSRLLGPNWTRLPEASRARREIVISIDDGPDPQVTPAVLQILDDFQARASFFVIGERLRRYPDIARQILRRGHSLENHSDRHPHSFSLLGPAGLRHEITQAQLAIAAVGGSARFFRAPAGLRNPFLEPQLQHLQLRLASWTRRGFDTVATDAALVQRRLERNLAAGDILLLHDGHAARDATGRPLVLDVLPRLLETLRNAGLIPVTLQESLQ